MIPQLILISLWVISLSVHSAKDGQPLSESQQKYNAGWALVRIIIIFLILYSGGFFDVFNN